MPRPTKQAARVPLPPFLIPHAKPGQTYTQEAIEENKRQWDEYERYVASHFTLKQLQEIVARTGAPPLKYTFNTHAILKQICDSIEQNLDRAEFADERKALKRRQKEWVSLRTYLGNMGKEEQSQASVPREIIWSGYKNFLERLSALILAMDAVEEELFPDGIRGRGEHKGAAFRSISTGCEIFERLALAWQEAGVSRKVADAKRYQIVRDCMEVIGEAASVDAIRMAIRKRLRENADRAKAEDDENEEENGF